MTELAILLLSLTSLGLLLALVRGPFSNRRNRNLTDLVAEEELLALTPAERVKAVGELIKARREDLAWYERSLSTGGVVAFFSMLIATGVQTTRAGIESSRAEALAKEIRQLESQRADLDAFLANVAETVWEQYRLRGQLDKMGEKAVRLRVDRLEDRKELGPLEMKEGYGLCLLIGDFECAVRFLGTDPGLLGDTDAADLLVLTEMSVITGAKARAKEQLQGLIERKSELKGAHLVRVLVLEEYLEPEKHESHVLELRRLLGLGEEAASLRLLSEEKKFGRGIENYRESSRSDGHK